MAKYRIGAVAWLVSFILVTTATGGRASSPPAPQPSPTSASASGTDVINPPDPRAASAPKPRATLVYFDAKLAARQKRTAQENWERALAVRKSGSSVTPAAAVGGVNQAGLGNSDNTAFAQSDTS